MFRLTDPPLRDQLRAVNWQDVIFWVVMFICIYFWPTEGRGEGKPVAVDIYPKIVMASPKTAEVRVRWRIPRHPDNRKYSFVMNADNGDYNLTSGDLDGEYDQVTFPTCIEGNQRPCYRTVRAGFYVFEACVYRITEGKSRRFCDSQTVEVR